jgi:hypothetical protein
MKSSTNYLDKTENLRDLQHQAKPQKSGRRIAMSRQLSYGGVSQERVTVKLQEN